MNDSHVDMSLPVAVDRCAQASFHEPPLFFQGRGLAERAVPGDVRREKLGRPCEGRQERRPRRVIAERRVPGLPVPVPVKRERRLEVGALHGSAQREERQSQAERERI